MMILSVAKQHPLIIAQIQQRLGREAMIIERARELAVRAPSPESSFPGCAGRTRAESGALPATVRSGLARSGRQSVCAASVCPESSYGDGWHSGHRPTASPEVCASVSRNAGLPAPEKTPPDAVEKLSDPLMFAAAMVSAGEADVCNIAGNLSSTANVLRAQGCG